MINLNTHKPDREPSGKGVSFGQMVRLTIRDHVFGSFMATKAQGRLTLAVQPANGETVNIGGRIYTFQTTLTNSDGNVALGGNVAATQANLVAAINLTGNPGSQYALATRINEQVSISDFSANVATITAKAAGTAGNAITTTETMANGSNVFDAATLGTYRAGADYQIPDFSFFPTFNFDGNNSGWAVHNPISSYEETYRNFPNVKPFVAALGKLKVLLPDHWGIKVKKLNSLAINVQLKRAVDAGLSGVTAHSGHEFYKMISVDATRGLALFRDSSASLVKVVIFSVDASGNLTFGTPVSLGFDNGIDVVDVVMIATDKALISYQGTGADMFTSTITISSLTPTINAGVITGGAITSVDWSRLSPLGTDKAVLTYKAAAVDPIMIVVTVSGTVPGYGSGTTLTGLQYAITCQNGTDKFQMFYRINASSAMFTEAVTVSGTSFTRGTAIRATRNDPVGGVSQHKCLQVATDKILYVTDGTDDEAFESTDVKMFTVSGVTTTLTFMTYSGYSMDGYVHPLINLGSNKIMCIKGDRMMLLELDLTNNRVWTRTREHAYTIFSNQHNFSYSGLRNEWQNNPTYGIVNGLAIALVNRRNPYNAPSYHVWPVTSALEFSVNGEVKKTVTHDYPFGAGIIQTHLDIDDYGASIEIKNPHNQEVIMYPAKDYAWIEL